MKKDLKNLQLKIKIKNTLFKVLHIIGYVCIGIVLIGSIALGVGSCNNKNKQQNNIQPQTQQRLNLEQDNYDLYKNIVNNNGVLGLNDVEFTFDIDVFKERFLNRDYSNGLYQRTGDGSSFKIQYFNNNTKFIYCYDHYDKDSISAYFNTDSIILEWNYEYLYIYCYTGGGSLARLLYYDFATNLYHYNEFDNYLFMYGFDTSANSNLIGLTLTRSDEQSKTINLFETNNIITWDIVVAGETRYNVFNYDVTRDFCDLFPIQRYDFNFINQLNLCNFFTNNYQGLFSLGSYSIAQYNNTYSYILNNGNTFISNNKKYDAIRIVAIEMSSSTSYTLNGIDVLSYRGISNMAVPFYMSYINTVLGYDDAVCKIDYLIDSNALYLNKYTWVNDNYRNIVILNKDFRPYLTFLGQPNKINSFDLLNNANQYVYGNYYSGSLGTTDNNVFTLLSQAFNSVSGLFSLSLLPGITIGILFFLPMVVTIIVLIFKLLRK